MTLRELRKERGLTLEAVGYLADLDLATVSRIERGLVQPRRETVVRLARALRVSVGRMVAIIENEVAS
jgi:transcriptional regulator with XRE-family HTH domain